jgi:hypothetical protein
MLYSGLQSSYAGGTPRMNFHAWNSHFSGVFTTRPRKLEASTSVDSTRDRGSWFVFSPVAPESVGEPAHKTRRSSGGAVVATPIDSLQV